MDMHISVVWRGWTLAFILASAATAQYPQYTAPGSLAVPSVPTRERIETGSDEARWDLGAVRVDPRFWLRQVGYNDNVFSASNEAEKVADVTATLGAGLVAYSNLGSDIIVSAYVLPEYSWWQDQDQLREEHLNLGIGLFGFYNRLTVIADARREERQRFLSSELLVPFDVQNDRATLRVDVDLRGPFRIFASGDVSEFSHGGEAASTVSGLFLEALDRRETIGRLGVTYEFPSGLRLGLGAELSEAQFDVDPAGRSNSSFGPLIEMSYAKDKASLEATLVLRDVDFDGPSQASGNEFTGSLRAGWEASRRLRIDAYGGRSLIYSVVGIDSFFTEQRVGLSIGSPWGERIRTRVYAELGTDEYDQLGSGLEERDDDVLAFGGEFDFEFSPRLALSVGAGRSDYDSNLAGLDREVTVVRVGLRVGGDPRPW